MMTLEQAKQSAPKLTNFLENQFIVGTPEDCHIVIIHGMSAAIQSINGERVLSSRVFAPTDYANDQQGRWLDQMVFHE